MTLAIAERSQNVAPHKRFRIKMLWENFQRGLIEFLRASEARAHNSDGSRRVSWLRSSSDIR
jgi:hypothetical protein